MKRAKRESRVEHIRRVFREWREQREREAACFDSHGIRTHYSNGEPMRTSTRKATS